MFRSFGAYCVILNLVLGLASTTWADDFDVTFTGKTLRFDYYHSGIADEEHISLDQIRLEGDWPGSRTQLLDHSNLGKYLFVVVDVSTQRTIYSRGFASIYGEWETTAEAGAGIWRTIHESQRFPEPKTKVQLVLRKRADDGSFFEIFNQVIDPTSRFVNRAPITVGGEVLTLVDNGPPAHKVDLLFLGDGYTAAEAGIFRKDVEQAVAAMFRTEPFASNRERFNVRALNEPAAASGVSDPRVETWLASPLGLSYNAFDSERYVLTFANSSVRELAAAAPYDALILLSNSAKYGGGGIFNLWSTVAAHSGQFEYIVVHEFGHSFAGLADEYYTSPTSYEDFIKPGAEPWEKNITALLDPENLKWRDLADPSLALPTPWNQQAYDEVSLAYQKRRQEMRAARASEEEMDALFAEIKATTEPMLKAETHAHQVGAFEGAGYQAKGLYRSSVDCIMFTRNPKHFCPVCAHAIEQVISMYAD